ncbi:MAG: glycoside hydrolase TIM-barrel-like domain-containing protein, partial [Hyphomicrobiales bacterium]|nr:glycoside hydrolase TIM-barrel-like domain-containing protein [Hyphomicrobiales bacterium]
MATLVLQTAGAVIGNLIGGPLGAIVGQTAGAIAGNAIDTQIFGQRSGNRVGPRLSSMPAIAASQGAAIPKVLGRARIGGNVIWMTRFEEQAIVSKTGGSGGKGGGGRTTTFQYYANFAVGLCEGPIAGVRRIWADGKEIDQTEINFRVHIGSDNQSADPLIVAKEGAAQAPAYRDLAYIVFECMPLESYGNRLPVLEFEIIRPVEALAEKITAVCLIPGSSEYGYDPVAASQLLGPGVTRGENRHQLFGDSDWNASLDNLQSLCPNLQSVALVVSWFGDDLRAGSCNVRPKVEIADKTTNGSPWSVAGLNRYSAPVVSLYDGKPAFGGTPADDAVVRAIQDLKARGLRVVFYPFVMMDIPGDNNLPDPWSGAAGQPAYPWRGRITCDPAPARAGTPDGTPMAGIQVDAFFGSPSPGPAEWSFRRFILHYAALCQQAGGVDAFLIGSELAALTRVRSASGQYPAAEHLSQLASDVAAILNPGTKISYAADWTEYGAHVLAGGDEVRFPLDVLWGNPDIAFVGVDAYWPLSDWRDDASHLDSNLAPAIYDAAYLRSRMTAGEAYDWYYPDTASRDAQDRAPITDGAYGKPWIFRPKDLHGWWSHAHFERVNGQELAQPSAWTPYSKPLWLTEIGCPAVEKGSNAPNVFPDAKSSENAVPYYSRGNRDDLIQLRTLEAMIDHFSPQAAGFAVSNNPVSPVYGGTMVSFADTHVWAWDARPFPAFPTLSDSWADGDAWATGHWLNGRLEAASLDAVVQTITREIPGLADWPLETRLGSSVDGFVIDRPMSARAALEPLAAFFGFDAIFSGGRLLFKDRSPGGVEPVAAGQLAANGDGASIELVRAQETELSRAVGVTVYDGWNDYRLATVQSRRIDGLSDRETHFDVPVVMGAAEARRRSDIFLQDMWAGRDQGSVLLPLSKIALETGDVLEIDIGTASRKFLISRIDDGEMREAALRSIDPSVFDHFSVASAEYDALPPALPGPADVRVLALAIARNSEPPLQYIAAFADPWPGALAIWSSAGDTGFSFDG